MKVFVSTVVRGAPMEKAGELIALDWDAKRVISRVPIFPSDPAVPDPNSRGGGRGGRGIAVLPTTSGKPNELFVVTYHTLLGFDFDLKPTRRISHGNFAGLHEVKAVEDGIWVSSTALGAVLKVDWNGDVLQEWWAHDDPLVREKFSPPPFMPNKQADNRIAYLEDFSKVHLNNVEVSGGRVYICFNNYGAVLRLFPTEIVAHDPALKGCHNGLVTADGKFLLNDSHHHTIVIVDLGTGQATRRINLVEFPEVSALAATTQIKGVSWGVRVKNFLIRKRMTRPLFTRGMCLLDDSRLLVGVSPATVLEIDYKQGRLLGLMQLSDSANECVHGLEAALPPA